MLQQPHDQQPRDHAESRPALPAPTQRVERCQGFLLTLAELGTDLARQVHRTATRAAEEAGPNAGPILDRASAAFDRTAIGVRRTVLLIEKLARPAPSAASAPAVIRPLQHPIRTHGDRPEALRSELHERVETVERAEDLGTRPPNQIIAAILRDLEHHPTERDQPSEPAVEQTQAHELAFDPARSNPFRDLTPRHTPRHTPTIPDG